MSSPTDLVVKFKASDDGKKAVQDLIFDFIQSLKRKGLAPKSMNVALAAVKSWFRWNECTITRQIKIRGVQTSVTLQEERIPQESEVNRALNFADMRQKIAIGLIAHGGLRFQSQSKLRLRDLLDAHLDIDKNQVVFDNPVCRLQVIEGASKNKRKYFVFLPARLGEWLKQYLDRRSRGGEKLAPESHLLASDQPTFSHGKIIPKGSPIGRQSIAKEVRICFDKAGIKERPYVLKSWCESHLESAGLECDRREFALGHVGPMSLQYGARKELPPEKVEELRAQFIEKVEPKLTGPSSVVTSDDVQTIVGSALATLVEPDTERDKLFEENYGINPKDVREAISEAGKAKAPKRQYVTQTKYLKMEEGWKVVLELRDGTRSTQSDASRLFRGWFAIHSAHHTHRMQPSCLP